MNFSTQHWQLSYHIEKLLLWRKSNIWLILFWKILMTLFFCSAVLFPCTYTLWCTQFKWYPICILTISFTHRYSIDRSQSMSETSGLLLFLAAHWDMGPLYLQINVTAERKHVTVTFSLVIHDQELFYFLFSLCWALQLCWNSSRFIGRRLQDGIRLWGATRWRTRSEVRDFHPDLLSEDLSPPAGGAALKERH